MLPDVPVSLLPSAVLPLNGTEVAILNQNGVTCTAPIGYFPPLTTISVSGDISGTGPAGALVLTLPNVNPNTGGPYNSVTVNAKGLITAATSITTVLSGDVSGSGIGPITVSIIANAVTNTKLAQMAAGTYKGNPTAATANPSDNRLPASGGGQLQRSTSTQVALMPKNGNQITFPNGYVYSISSAGLLSGSIAGSCCIDGAAASTLVANTLYYVYLWYNSGAPAIDFSLTGHATDATTGIEIKSGDATRVLLGMVYPQTGPVIVDSSTARLVASWFNRQPKYLSTSFSQQYTINNTSLVDINPEIHGLFLSWGDAFDAFSNHSAYASDLGDIITNGIGIDGTATFVASLSLPNPSIQYPSGIMCGGFYAPSEGQHYITIGGAVSGGSAVWNTGSLQARMTI